jgi:hypothetical protein
MSMPFHRLISTLEPFDTEETRAPRKVFGATARFAVAFACSHLITPFARRQSSLPRSHRAHFTALDRRSRVVTAVARPNPLAARAPARPRPLPRVAIE